MTPAETEALTTELTETWADGFRAGKAARATTFAAPGPPPRPNLVWKESTHRWINPHTGEEHPAAPAVSPPVLRPPRPVAAPAPAPKGSELPGVMDVRKELKTAAVPKVAHENAGRVAAAATPEDRQFLSEYTKERGAGDNPLGYAKLNKAARSCPADLACLSEEQRKAFSSLDTLAAKGEFSEPVVAYRGVKLLGENREQFLAMIQQSQDNNQPIQFHGITSSSLDPMIAGGHGGGDIVLEIKTKTGAYIDPISDVGGEHEILHSHGTKYRVLGIQKRRQYEGVGGNITAIQMEEVRP